ncbi:hypothetical protein ACMFMG_007162 [Clarireedia jacksonii]
MVSFLLLCPFSLLLFTSHAFQTYNLDTKYEGPEFFNGWDFFTNSDPTHGFVTYLNEDDASSAGILGKNGYGPAYMGVDHTNVLDPAGPGRNSLRITSKKSWTHGLFIADIEHMPGSVCGTWPAFWMFGTNWPNNGEIDIIEGVNRQKDNEMTLHTSANCQMPNLASAQLGALKSGQCDVSFNYNAGCGITARQGQNTYGDDFNSHGGGVYATEWTSDHIKIWFFPRYAIPHDIYRGKPNPDSWSRPQAFFQGSSSCDIDTHFAKQNLVFDTTFCGDWAGNAWSGDAVCSRGGNLTCQQFVAARPEAFMDTFWLVNSVKVYQQEDCPPDAASSPYLNVTASALKHTISLTSRASSPASLEVPGSDTRKSRSLWETLRAIGRRSSTKGAV